jgi:hypothetical protein
MVQESLTAMDAMVNIQDRLYELYQGKDFRPRVHAELNLLEYKITNTIVIDTSFHRSYKFLLPSCSNRLDIFYASS